MLPLSWVGRCRLRLGSWVHYSTFSQLHAQIYTDRISYSYGRNKTALAQHWGQWDKTRFTNNVQNFMVEYLKTAFSEALFCYADQRVANERFA
jgi:hypothetical protein